MKLKKAIHPPKTAIPLPCMHMANRRVLHSLKESCSSPPSEQLSALRGFCKQNYSNHSPPKVVSCTTTAWIIATDVCPSPHVWWQGLLVGRQFIHWQALLKSLVNSAGKHLITFGHQACHTPLVPCPCCASCSVDVVHWVVRKVKVHYVVHMSGNIQTSAHPQLVRQIGCCNVITWHRAFANI